MSELFSQLYLLLVDVVLPNLEGIETSQAEQRAQTDRVRRDIEEFRAEMQLRFAEMRAEIAACRLRIEDAMVTLGECEPVETVDPKIIGPAQKKTLVH